MKLKTLKTALFFSLFLHHSSLGMEDTPEPDNAPTPQTSRSSTPSEDIFVAAEMLEIIIHTNQMAENQRSQSVRNINTSNEERCRTP